MIGTGAAIAIAALAGTGSSVYSTKKAASQNKQALNATERSDIRADTRESDRLAEERRALDVQLAEKKRADDERLKYDREEAARKERQYNEAVAMDRQRWQDYLRINEPMWRQGAGVLGSLYDIAGFQGGAPAYAPPTQPSPTSGGGPMTLPPSSGVPIVRPISAARPRPTGQPATYQTMPMPSRDGMSSLTSLMQLAQLADASKMPTPAYRGDVNLSTLALG